MKKKKKRRRKKKDPSIEPSVIPKKKNLLIILPTSHIDLIQNHLEIKVSDSYIFHSLCSMLFKILFHFIFIFVIGDSEIDMQYIVYYSYHLLFKINLCIEFK